jgi:glycosyltransferase involved in cell wall biosynthesis
MKVLIIHNFYQSSSPSGEDVVFKNEVELLKKNSINVITYTRHNDEIEDYGVWAKFTLPFKNIWSKRTYRELIELIKKEKPDIAHFHNIWYLISPSAYYACKDAGVPVVQTLHNFRIFCANGLLMRNGKVCEECIGKLPYRAILYGCYRNSRLFSIPVAFTEGIHNLLGTWGNIVDVYIALTEFGRRKFIEAGLPADKIFVKPNFLLNPPQPNYSHQNYACFIGRISEEKGVDIVLESFKLLKNLQFRLKIVGDGPLRNYYEKKVERENINGVEFLGRKEHSECIEILRNAKFLIMPSICYETFAMTVIEAFACGKPVVASNLGALAELVQDGKTGLLFEPGNPKDLAEKIKWMVEHKDACIEMGRNARKVFEEKYTAERNFETLIGIYNKAVIK